MGSWFTNYFTERGYNVSTYDVNKTMLSDSRKVKVSSSISTCVRSADFVLVCVPVSVMPAVIAECLKSMKKGAVISEISSVKTLAFKALRKAPQSVVPICIHPMFGPGASKKAHEKMLMVPVRNKEAELKILHKVFEHVAVKVLPDAQAHDRSIGIILGLTYFANIVFAKVVSTHNISSLKQVSGTTFRLQSIITESILTNEIDLVSAIVQENSYARKYIRQYLKESTAVAKMAYASDSKKLKNELKKIRSKMQKWQDLQQSYERMYNIIGNMK